MPRRLVLEEDGTKETIGVGSADDTYVDEDYGPSIVGTYEIKANTKLQN